ncbi:MAG: MarC family protein [Candidatus Wukongarchaeota archaeon]|nr:MarC family protein [Candidatus Wukongarchaeota archaeon]MDO8128430.1 MarC family protein [Candidatus Wukongarchaeota archaeon]
MSSFSGDFSLAFLNLFVMLNAIGTVPIFLSLTDGSSPLERREIAKKSAIVAGSIVLVFIFLGKYILEFFHIKTEDFFVAGGLILLILALDFTTGKNVVRSYTVKKEELAVVPLGTPLLAGPGTITMSIILTYDYGPFITALAAIANGVIAWLILKYSDLVIRKIGSSGINAASRVLGLLLAAIAVSMIRRGITGF